MKSDPTYIGNVRRVVGARVMVELSNQLPSASPIIGGRLYQIGQPGSFVRIPLGFVNLYGIVSMVGVSELVDTGKEDLPVPHGQRWLEVQLVGEAVGKEPLQRGVSISPTIDDEVHIVTESDLATIYASDSPNVVPIGTHSASEGLTAFLSLDNLVTRHAAIVGSTGSGKSNAVAALIKALVTGGYASAQVVVIDPHGEYEAAFPGAARVFKLRDQASPLLIPYWALPFDELAWFLVDRRAASESLPDATLRARIAQARQESCASLKAGRIDPENITADSPIPFSVKELWYQLDREEHVTYKTKERTEEALRQEGNADRLIPAQFELPGLGSSAPFKPQQPSAMGPYVAKILARLKDPKFDFLLSPDGYDGNANDLHDLIGEWIGHDHPITVLDLAGVPFEVVDVVVAAVTRILFETMVWGRDLPGMGRERPLLLVFEEAHGYLPRGEDAAFIAGYARRAVRRVLREGRKYGVGAVLVSQRPSELDETILSQCGTFFAMRLANAGDQGQVKASVPDSLAGLLELLPALRTGEAIVLGESLQVPSRVRISLVEPRPTSADAAVAAKWKAPRLDQPRYEKAVTAWRTHGANGVPAEAASEVQGRG